MVDEQKNIPVIFLYVDALFLCFVDEGLSLLDALRTHQSFLLGAFNILLLYVQQYRYGSSSRFVVVVCCGILGWSYVVPGMSYVKNGETSKYMNRS